ncbi:RES family NAD+ phosphorylase [Rhodopseudomonas palustris]|uniref:RES family NAD+ phosphorylase n=1 Tax=Rhodopseudomonas palustris TaxID=1076 RepID=UPI001F182D45|nr:RES family NAD+ phosphorylase [Rhodopseudomonas palustris]
MVYLADHPSSAVLEMQVHMDREFLPATYQLLRIAVPGDLEANVIAPNDLPLDWANRLEASRQVGDNWLDHGTSPLLRVPSAIVPQADNFLLNPAHPDAAQIAIAEVIRAPFDPRLIGG